MLSAFPAPVHFPPFLCIQNRKITETETLLFFCSNVYARKQPTAIRAIAAKMMRTLCGSTNRLKINTPVMIRIMPVDITLQFLFLLEGLFLLCSSWKIASSLLYAGYIADIPI